ncbi:MAG: GTPase HflX, partial [Dehalococcoidia bacterium]
IGTRGPGETQLETDRRLIRNKIRHLKAELERVRRQRSLYRRQRAKQGLPVVSLVGYTNAGKSTLMRALSGADVLVEDRLFATLDPLTRRIDLPGGDVFLLTDTVGFIQKLPAQLVAAFRATLEELAEAALLVHVVDITHPNAAEQSEAVEDTLTELGLADKPQMTVLNKVDLLRHKDGVPLEGIEGLGELEESLGRRADVVMVSALEGWGIPELLVSIQGTLTQRRAVAGEGELRSYRAAG